VDILHVQNISKIYGTGDAKVTALDDVSFNREKGEFVAIIGPSGSGKSTLLHKLGGCRPADHSGKVLIEGTDLYSHKRDRRHRLLPPPADRPHLPVHYLIPVLNARRIFPLPLLLDERASDSEQLSELLNLLSMKDRAKHLPNQLSGGLQQRLSIGRALIANPVFVLADEPTGNLDSKNSADSMELLKLSNRRYNQTLILITHDPNIALLCGPDHHNRRRGRIAKDEVIRR
jgi:putative ABC transport system ATP-binding protein